MIEAQQKQIEFREYFLLSFTNEILNEIAKQKNFSSFGSSIEQKVPEKEQKKHEFSIVAEPEAPVTNEYKKEPEVHIKKGPIKIMQHSEPIKSGYTASKYSSTNYFDAMVSQENKYKRSRSTSTIEPVPMLNKTPTYKPVKGSGPLNIPEPILPPHLQYLRPRPEEVAMDFGKIDPLIKDNAVRIIECRGPDEKVFVRGAMGIKPTAITLREDEINSIIKDFSDKSKIPIQEGVYHIAVGRYVLSAVVSNVIPPKFIIEKMKYPQEIMRPPRFR